MATMSWSSWGGLSACLRCSWSDSRREATQSSERCAAALAARRRAAPCRTGQPVGRNDENEDQEEEEVEVEVEEVEEWVGWEGGK